MGRLRSQRRERQRVAGVVDLWSCGGVDWSWREVFVDSLD